MNTVAVSQAEQLLPTAPQGDPPAFATATIRDPAGRTLRLTGCDAGTTNFLCDQVAHLALRQPRWIRASSGSSISSYDPLGRLLEEASRGAGVG